MYLSEYISDDWGTCQFGYEAERSMTAIARIEAAGAFVIGADGLQTDADARIVSATAQKIFWIHDPRMSVAYALIGAARCPIGPILFDLQGAITKAIRQRDTMEFRSLQKYSESLAAEVFDTLLETVNMYTLNGRFQQPPGAGKRILQVVMGGYYEGSPAQSDIEFSCDEGILRPPHVSPGGMRFYGPAKAHEALAASFDLSSSAFAIDTAIEICAAWISQCGLCEPTRIGGKTHMSIVRKGQPPQWIAGFEPASGSAE